MQRIWKKVANFISSPKYVYRQRRKTPKKVQSHSGQESEQPLI